MSDFYRGSSGDCNPQCPSQPEPKAGDPFANDRMPGQRLRAESCNSTEAPAAINNIYCRNAYFSDSNSQPEGMDYRWDPKQDYRQYLPQWQNQQQLQGQSYYPAITAANYAFQDSIANQIGGARAGQQAMTQCYRRAFGGGDLTGATNGRDYPVSPATNYSQPRRDAQNYYGS